MVSLNSFLHKCGITHFHPIVVDVVSGFGRVILAIISFYFMPTHCILACVCYVTSALLDAIDGHAARYFNQSKCFIRYHIIQLLIWSGNEW